MCTRLARSNLPHLCQTGSPAAASAARSGSTSRRRLPTGRCSQRCPRWHHLCPAGITTLQQDRAQAGERSTAGPQATQWSKHAGNAGLQRTQAVGSACKSQISCWCNPAAPACSPRCAKRVLQSRPGTRARGCQLAPLSLEESTAVRLGRPHSGKKSCAGQAAQQPVYGAAGPPYQARRGPAGEPGSQPGCRLAAQRTTFLFLPPSHAYPDQPLTWAMNRVSAPS